MKPDSVLARTAREVLAAHAGGAGPRDGMTICPVCGDLLPCASGRAAAEVLFAAGLAESSGLVEAARQGLGPKPGSESPLGLSAAAGVASVPPSATPLGLGEPASEHPVTPESPPGEWWPTGTGGSVADALGGENFSSMDGPGGFGGGESSSAGGLSAPHTAISPPEPVGPSADEQPSGLSFSPPVSTPPSTAGDGLTGSRDARGDFVFEPDIGAAPQTPVPQPEPQVPEEIDPLLLGPPLFDQQNRPLDAPQFRRSPRPNSAMPAPAPAAGFSAGQQGSPFREPGHAGGQFATGPAEAQPGSPVPAAGAPAAGWPPPAAQPQAAGEGGWSSRPQPGRPQGGQANAGQPHAGPAQGWGQAEAGARPSAADVSYLAGVSEQGDQPRDADRDQQQRTVSPDSAFTARTKPSGLGANPSLHRPGQFEQPGHHGQPNQGPSDQLDRPAQPGHPGQLGQAAHLGRPDQPYLSGGPVTSMPPGPDVNDPQAGRAAPRPGRPPLEAPEMGQLNRPLETPIASEPGPSLPHNPAAAVGQQAATAPLGRPPQTDRPTAGPRTGAPSGFGAHPAAAPQMPVGHGSGYPGIPSGLGAHPAAAPQMPAGDGPGNPATPSGLPGVGPATDPDQAATLSAAWNAGPKGGPSDLPVAQPPQATPWAMAEQPGDDTPGGPSSRPAEG